MAMAIAQVKNDRPAFENVFVDVDIESTYKAITWNSQTRFREPGAEEASCDQTADILD
jgi:hypothetical protein